MKKHELTVLAMYVLGGGDHALDIEDVAMRCEEIVPGCFAWRKYEKQINLELVGFAVRDAKKAINGSLVTGNHAKGWRLTLDGVIFGRKLFEESDSLKRVSVKAGRVNSLSDKKMAKEVTRVISSNAFIAWSDTGKSEKSDLCQLLKINSYSSPELVDIKITRLAKLIGSDEKFESFLSYLASIKGSLHE